MTSKLRDAQIHRLVGGALCLDFANTLNGRRHPDLHEYLFDYHDLVLWSRHAGILSQDETTTLLHKMEQEFDLALDIFEQTIRLRETIYRLFSSQALGDTPKPADLKELQFAWMVSLAHSRFIPHSAGYSLDWTYGRDLECILWPILDSAVKLLTSPDLERVRICDSERCDWLFVDTSRNHMRRWCSMEQCGNRAKMRRRYARAQKS